MFSDDDFGLRELREIALSFPSAFEKVSWGRPVFCVPKIFVMYGGNMKGETSGDMTPFPHSMLVKVEEADRAALEQDRRFYLPAYVGAYGWLGMDFTVGKVNWKEVRELVDASYRLIAPKKLIKQLDEL
jgi:predicted DNA-binding protein (MmcQ/YjbR family)